MPIKTGKKTVRASAKSAAKKNVPKPKEITAKELTAILDGYSKRMDDAHAETELAMKKAFASIDALSAESRKTDAKIKEMTENGIRLQELVERLSDNIGGLNNRIGILIEMIVVPMIRLDLNKHGNHSFEDIATDKIVKAVVGGRKKEVAEVDMFLSGATEAMAVEIKSQLKISYVEAHLRRLQTLRKYETEADILGKQLFGAVVGVSVDGNARALAKKNGMYVIEIREKEDSLVIDAPETCRIW